jgi:DnaA family protein
MKQIPLAIGVDSVRTFDNFLPGANAPALAHLNTLSPQAAPVYLWGATGSGKTHLLEALVHRFESQGARAGWFSAADPAPWPLAQPWSLIVLDGCDALDPDQQHAAFALFVDASTRGVPVVGAGRVPPVDLPLREDLRTRLAWGHVFAIQPLGEAEVRAALRRDADRRGIWLSDEVMDYLLTRFDRDLKHLIGQLDRLDAFSLSTKRVITVPLLKQMLAQTDVASAR